MKWKKKSYIKTVEVPWLISLAMGLQYFTVYAVSIKGALPLPFCICGKKYILLANFIILNVIVTFSIRR